MVRLKDGTLGVVAAVGELGAWESLETARTLEVVDRSPDVPVDVTPRRQLVPCLQKPLAHVPRSIHLVSVRESAVTIYRHPAMHKSNSHHDLWFTG